MNYAAMKVTTNISIRNYKGDAEMNRLNLRILRGFMGLSQKELGSLLDKEQCTISRYEEGIIQIPNAIADRVEELAKDIGITDMELVMLQQLINASAHSSKKVSASND